MAKGYTTQFDSKYKEDSTKKWYKRDTTANYEHLSRELKAIGHRADAEDMMETVQELGVLRTRRAVFDQRRQDFATRAAYTTLDKAITAYRAGKIRDKHFNDILYRTQHQLSDALHAFTPEELAKKPFHRLRLTDIVTKELAKQAAAILLFALGVFSLDQSRVTGMAVGSVSASSDYYSLFGFLLVGLAVFILARKN
ncbi:hypothetical protein J4208_02465 [Candidatus Woesearchaeota archaeon]|nr:hypothetical protein [Candidatus Woesearchaeota archaeon]